VSAFLIGTNSVLAMFGRLGLESMLAATCVVLAVRLHLRSSKDALWALATSAAFGIAMLTRPDAALVFGGCMLWSIAENYRASKRLLAREDLVVIAGVFCIIGVHMLWRHSFYGYWLPNTYYAKVGGPLDVRLRHGLVGLWDCLDTPVGFLMASGVVLWCCGPKRPEGVLLAGLASISAIGLIGEGVEYWPEAWQATIFYLFVLLLVAHAVAIRLEQPVTARRGAWLGVLAWIAIMGADLLSLGGTMRAPPIGERTIADWSIWIAGSCAFAVATSMGTGWAGWTRPHISAAALIAMALAPFLVDTVLVVDQRVQSLAVRCRDPRVEMGRKLREIARPGDTLATGAAGAIPYYSGLTTFDTLGLNDVHIAHMPMPERHVAFGHDRGDGAYILSKRPTFLIASALPTPSPDPGPGFELTFDEIFRTEQFRHDYEFSAIPLCGQFFNIYRTRVDAK
jgi:hypothetical protein